MLPSFLNKGRNDASDTRRNERQHSFLNDHVVKPQITHDQRSKKLATALTISDQVSSSEAPAILFAFSTSSYFWNKLRNFSRRVLFSCHSFAKSSINVLIFKNNWTFVVFHWLLNSLLQDWVVKTTSKFFWYNFSIVILTDLTHCIVFFDVLFLKTLYIAYFLIISDIFRSSKCNFLNLSSIFLMSWSFFNWRWRNSLISNCERLTYLTLKRIKSFFSKKNFNISFFQKYPSSFSFK